MRAAQTLLSVFLIIIAVLLGGCGDAAIPVMVIDDTVIKESSMGEADYRARAGEMPDVVSEGCDILGIECYLVDESYGAVVINIVPIPPSNHAGMTLRDGVCNKVIRVAPYPETIAHELAHLFITKEHSQDPDSVLYWKINPDGDWSLTEEQVDTMYRRVARFQMCA